jgi:hypothetical protein
MALEVRYKPAGQDVVSEEIDGEVIIVNLNNGNYYSLAQSAAVIWAAIQEHATLQEMQNRLYLRYSGETSAINHSLDELINALEAEQLIVREAASEPGPETTASATEAEQPDHKEVFLPPIFERFTDMEDLLLLDPVHETEDDKGWPHAKENT